MGSHVLVPFDGSDCARRAVDYAVDRFPDATVTLLSVVEPLSETGQEASEAPIDEEAVRADGAQSPAEEFVAGRAAEGRGDGTLRAATEPGMPAATIAEYAAEHDVDAVVMGRRDRSDLRRLVSGSTSKAVVDVTDVPVTLVD